MSKMTAKQMQHRAIELYYEGKHNELEQLMLALAERAPVVHRRTVDTISAIINEQSLLDSVGGLYQ